MSSAFEMRHSSSSSSRSTSTSSSKSRRRKWSKDELMKNLAILGALSAPPAPELPPSPPASRSSSPAPGSKRKAAANTSDSNKRPRLSNVQDRSSHQRPAPSSVRHSRNAPADALFNIRSEPSEDGEVHEESIASSSRLPPASVALTATVPIRRPRADKMPPYSHFEDLHREFHERGRALKYSGTCRWWSSYPSNSKEYVPLHNPPPPGSPYHINAGVIARLELVDALVCFTYAMWSKEYARGGCDRKTWQTSEGFLKWCKGRWEASDTHGDRENALKGLIWMIEGYIHARKSTSAVRPIAGNLASSTQKTLYETKMHMIAAAREERDKFSPHLLSAGTSHLTPQGLPSPANSAPTNSAQSTPTNPADRSHDDNASSSSRITSQGSRPSLLHPEPFPPEFFPKGEGWPRAPDNNEAIDNAMRIAASKVTASVSPHYLSSVHDHLQDLSDTRKAFEQSQKTLTLPIMAKCFPTTFARMVSSNLSADQEWHPDMDDDEGELFWPSQSATGEGLGWVCLMGKAMINEIGKDYGYKGLRGVAPKPPG